MAAPVFYSVCPFGTGTIEAGAGNISIASGVATLTVEQTGNLGAGVCIEYNSLECYIAPNRIAFTSGGSVELLVDTKITGATSGATGIVRAVELTSGTWAGGNAAGWIYFEATTGTWNSSEQINRTKPTASTNIATTSGSLQGNIGSGNTQFVVKTATGGTPSNQSATAVTSIHHEYASLSAFEAGFTDSSHINNTSLVAADVVAHACCYYDHVDYTADTDALVIEFGTTDVARYLQIYTVIGGAESINNQRHSGIWDVQKSIMDVSSSAGGILSEENYIYIQGLQVDNDNAGASTACIQTSRRVEADNLLTVDACLLLAKGGSNGFFLFTNWTGDVPNGRIVNSIIYNSGSQASGSEGIYLDQGVALDAFHCTIYNFNDGVERDAGTLTASNCAVFNNADDFDGAITITHCASDDGDGTNAVDWTAGASDWANVFNDYANGDFSLNNFTGTGAIIGQGTDLSSAEGIWRDIAGNERGSTPDIGAFEYTASGALLSVAGLDGTGSLDNIALSQKHTLAIQELLSSGALDNIVLQLASILAVDSLSGDGLIDNADLSQKHNLAIQALLSSGVLDNVALSQKHTLAIQELLSSGALDNITLELAALLAVADLISAGTLDDISLSQKHTLSVHEVLSSGVLDNITLEFSTLLSIADLISAGTLDDISLSQKHTLAIQELLSSGTIDNITLSLSALLMVADMVSSGALDGLELTQRHLLAIQGLLSTGLLDDTVLSQKHSLDVQALSSAGHLDGISLIFSTLLAVSDLLSDGVVDNIDLEQGLVLSIDEVLSSGHIDAAELTQKHFLVANSLLSSGVIDNIRFDIASGLIYISLSQETEYNAALTQQAEYEIGLTQIGGGD